MKIMAVANQKGGVGKTTTTVHLAHYAIEQGKRVLVVDFDPQANTSGCFTSSQGPHLVASALFTGADEGKQPEMIGGVGLIRADKGLKDVEAMDLDIIKKPALSLRRFADQFDLCIIDTPPTLGRRLMGALIAADSVVTPFSLEKFSLDGIGELIKTIQTVRTKGLNSKLKFLGILPNRVKTRSKRQQAALESLREAMGAYLLPHVIVDRVAVSDALDDSRPVWLNDKGKIVKTKAAAEMRGACETIFNEVFK